MTRLLALLLLIAAAPAGDPLLKPVAADSAARWLSSQTPAKIWGNTYAVGFKGLSVSLIRTSAGLILIDGALPQAVPAIEANIRQLGFDPKDIRLILSTEPHYDHASGIAALARDSGAAVIASAPAAAVLRQGHTDAADPQAAWLIDYPPVARVRTVRDGEVIRLGDVKVTARATPGHTAGSMSWTWTSCEGAACKSVVFASSLNPIAADGWSFADPAHKAVVDSFRHSFGVVATLPCDILLSAHPDNSGGDVKYARLLESRDPNAFVDPGACRAYADKARAALDAKLAAK